MRNTNNREERVCSVRKWRCGKMFKKILTYLGYTFLAIFACIAVIAICYGLMSLSHSYALENFELPKDSTDSKEALFGDSFGSVNAIISAFAFIGVIVALFMQQKQIKLQQKELKDNTLQLSLQRREFEEQNKNIRLQRFENTFFQMLSLHHEIVAGLKITMKLQYPDGTGTDRVEIVGRNLFRELYRRAKLKTGSGSKEFIGLQSAIEEEGLQGYYKFGSLSAFDHYFRNLYRIFKLVDSTSERTPENKNGILTLEEKKDYAAIVRASLSEFELVILFFNCIYMKTVNKEPQFKEFAEKYHLFNNVRKDKIGEVIFNTFQRNEEYKYDDSAFNW